MKKLFFALIFSIISFFAISCEDHSDSPPDTPDTRFKYESFGHPNCANAVEDPMVQIKNFKLSLAGDGRISYSWASQTRLEVWGISDPSAAKALAVAGYKDPNGTWKFAKFDWISSSRLSRDLKNLKGYNGWNYDAFKNASKHGFFIMTENGRKRSNIITD